MAIAALLAATVMALVMAPVRALAGSGQPSPWQKGLQEAATPIAADIHWFHDFVTIIIFVITLFVLALLLWVIVRYNEKANPTPSQVTHNTALEFAWTVIPIIILIVIAVPSFKLLYAQYAYPKPDLTIKAIGNAWFWEHEYPDHDGFKVTSNMLKDEDILRTELGAQEFERRYKGLDGLPLIKRLYADAQPLWVKQGRVRMLSVDNEIAVPENKNIHVLVTANDVIHNWTIPSFGSKVDAVPGRVTATWFRATRRGMFYGQCSELCGKDHAAMPIAVRVVTQQAFDQWSGALKAARGERDSNRRREHLNRAREVLRQAALEDDGKPGVRLAESASGAGGK